MGKGLDRPSALVVFRGYEHMFYTGLEVARPEYFEIVSRSALNRVHHMGFNWSLNP